jgi:hypothetical protein
MVDTIVSCSLSDSNPDLIGSLDPDRDLERQKLPQKRKSSEISCSEVLYFLFGGLEASPVLSLKPKHTYGGLKIKILHDFIKVFDFLNCKIYRFLFI